MNKDIINVEIYNGDDEIKYIRYDDMILMLNRIKEDNEERDKEIERLNKENEKLKEMKLHTEKYASQMEDKYIENQYVLDELEKWLEEVGDRVITYGLIDDTYKSTNLYCEIEKKIKELRGE